MKAIEKVPVKLQKELAGFALQIQNNAAAIFDLLDRNKGPVKAKAIQAELLLTASAYRNACRLLEKTSVGLYFTQDGLVLKEYISSDDQRYWHLAWSLGLFEISGTQLILDRDLLKQVPAALKKLRDEGKLTQENRLDALRSRTRQAIGVLVEVLDMYNEVNRALEVASLPEVTGKDWKKTLGKVKKELSGLPPKRR
jgi:hypothetical protein